MTRQLLEAYDSLISNLALEDDAARAAAEFRAALLVAIEQLADYRDAYLGVSGDEVHELAEMRRRLRAHLEVPHA